MQLASFVEQSVREMHTEVVGIEKTRREFWSVWEQDVKQKMWTKGRG